MSNSFKYALICFKKNFLAPNTFRLMNQIIFSIFVQGFCRIGGSKSISMALVKIKPQNELGDIIPDICVKFNRFRVIHGFFIFVQRVV